MQKAFAFFIKSQSFWSSNFNKAILEQVKAVE